MPIAIGRNDMPGTGVLRRIEIRNSGRESLHDLLHSLTPIRRTHDHHEIIAANMPYEIQSGRSDILEQRGQMEDHLVAVRESVHVVVGFEVIEIEIAHDKPFTSLDEFVDATAYGAIAR